MRLDRLDRYRKRCRNLAVRLLLEPAHLKHLFLHVGHPADQAGHPFAQLILLDRFTGIGHRRGPSPQTAGPSLPLLRNSIKHCVYKKKSIGIDDDILVVHIFQDQPEVLVEIVVSFSIHKTIKSQ